MKKILSVLFFAFATLGVSASWGAIDKSKTIKMATEGAFPPFNYFKGKDLTGFEVELGTELAKKLHVNGEWKTSPFDSLLIGLNQNRYDLVVASHGITAERAKAVDFTEPHYCTGGIIISNAGGPKTAADLKGKVVAVQVGTTYLTNVQKIPGIKEVKTYPKDTDALQNLMSKRVDAWVTDKFVALEAVKSNEKLHLQLGDMVFQEKIAMAVAKGNTELKNKVNTALNDLVKDGTYLKISKKYFNDDVSCK
ncbi:MAG: ABC transporter substrate-binding protein [Bdellovibrionota bacterium]